MTKKELIEQLKDMPDDAVVFVVSDHGQSPEESFCIDISSTPESYWDDTDEIDWKGNKKAITAILIS